MNQVATTQQRSSPVELYAAQVIGDDARSADLFRALPKHISAARFQRNLLNLLMQKPEMMKYDARLVYREVSKAAALGLALDPQLGEGYIVPVWNGQARREEPQLRVGYRGIMKLARQSGEIANLYPGEVREKDHFLADEGTEKRLEHQPDYRRSRGETVCYYAVVIYKDGTKDFEVMDLDSIYEIREKSDAWRAFQAGKIKSTPWFTDEGEMCKKTVLKRLLKRIPQSPDLADALGHDSEIARQPAAIIDIAQTAKQPPASIESRLDQFAETHEDTDPADTAPPADVADQTETEADAQQPEASAETAPPPLEPANRSAGGAVSPDPMPASVKDAMDKGRAARLSGFGREVPRNLQYKARQAEAAAFLRGWDEEDLEIKAAESGTV